MPEGSTDNGTGPFRDHPLNHPVRAGELRAGRQDDLEDKKEWNADLHGCGGFTRIHFYFEMSPEKNAATF